MAKAHATLSRWWNANGAAPPAARPGRKAVRRIERSYGVMLPRDFRAYLLAAAPATEFCDREVVSWWSPHLLRSVREQRGHRTSCPEVEGRAHTYLVFADHMHWSWAWAICCGNGADRGRVALIGGVPDHVVADSFTGFVRAYVSDPASVS